VLVFPFLFSPPYGRGNEAGSCAGDGKSVGAGGKAHIAVVSFSPFLFFLFFFPFLFPSRYSWWIRRIGSLWDSVLRTEKRME